MRSIIPRPGFEIRMGWRHVLFANWPVEPSTIADRIPPGLTVDTFDGRAWLTAVPFTNHDLRPTWWPAGWGFGLPELNLRTYVHIGEEPGVYFYTLDAQGLLGVLGGRWLHGLPYRYARVDLTPTDDGVRFRSRRLHPGAAPCRFRARYTPTGDRFEAEPGSLERFLAERYRYYVADDSGVIRYANVRHDPWPLRRVDVEFGRNELFAANGFDEPDSDPVYLYSPGVDVVASASRRV